MLKLFKQLLFIILPLLLRNQRIPYHDSLLRGHDRYLELMRTRNNRRFHDKNRMDKPTFDKLLRLLRLRGGLKDSKHICAGEKLMIYISVLKKGNSNRDTAEDWQHSGSRISIIINEVANCFEKVEKYLFYKPSNETPGNILNNAKFTPFFNDCMGAIDGCHCSFFTKDSLFRNRKGWKSTNVLAAVNFDLTFSYVLVGWEGCAHDGEVLADAILNDFLLQNGRYYLADAGYALTKYFLTPYRGVRYHLKEWATGNRRPQNYKELYNLRHSSLRNAVERAFGILKKRFEILVAMPSYPPEVQVKLIKSCFMIHNFIRRNQGFEDIFDEWEDNEIQDPIDNRENFHNIHNDIQANNLREQIALAMWNSYQDYINE